MTVAIVLALYGVFAALVLPKLRAKLIYDQAQ